MIYLKRYGNESIERFLRRVSDTMKRTKYIQKIRYMQFKRRKPNKTAKKKSAIFKNEKKQKMDYLKKIGKLPERPQYRRWSR